MQNMVQSLKKNDYFVTNSLFWNFWGLSALRAPTVGPLDGFGADQFGCGGFGFCLLFSDPYPSFHFEGTQENAWIISEPMDFGGWFYVSIYITFLMNVSEAYSISIFKYDQLFPCTCGLFAVRFFLQYIVWRWQGTLPHRWWGWGGTNICSIHHSIYVLFWIFQIVYLTFLFLAIMEIHQARVAFKVFCPPRRELLPRRG